MRYMNSLSFPYTTPVFDKAMKSVSLPMMINELDLLIGSIVSHTVVDQHVKPIPRGPHVDEQGDGISNMDRSSDSVSIQAITRLDLHEAVWGCEGEHHGVGCVGSGQPS